MPELPEVETMVRGLRGALAGRTLRRVEAVDPYLLQGRTREEFEERVRGAAVAAVSRRGKWAVLELGLDRGIIVIQPRMTGGFWTVAPPRPEHVRLVFHVAKPRSTVWYCDARRLGKIYWHEDARAAERAFVQSQGPDALTIGRDELAERLARTARPIKPALMDQKVLAGIGNIYADEVLHRARIHPERGAKTLALDEIDRIHRAIGAVLNEAIALEGSSFDGAYRTVLGREGGFLSQNAAYGRAGLPCPNCARPIVRARIAGLAGRSTYYCPECQGLDGRSGPRRPSPGAEVPTSAETGPDLDRAASSE